MNNSFTASGFVLLINYIHNPHIMPLWDIIIITQLTLTKVSLSDDTVLLACGLSCVQLFVTPWILDHQPPLSMGFLRQEYWSGLPFSPPEDLPLPGIEPASLLCLLYWQAILYHWVTWEQRTPAGSNVRCCMCHELERDSFLASYHLIGALWHGIRCGKPISRAR